MDFYLARNDSLRMLRWARRQKGVCLLAHSVAGEPGLKMAGRPAPTSCGLARSSRARWPVHCAAVAYVSTLARGRARASPRLRA